VTTAYTANLAATLTRDVPGDSVRSMQDAVAKGSRICAPAVLVPSVKYLYPLSNTVPIAASRLVKVFETGDCDAAIFALAETRDAQFVDALCNNDVAAIQNVFDVPLAFPATSLAGALSYYIVRMPLGRNTYQDQYERPYRVDRCPGPGGKAWQDTAPSVSDGSSQLYLSHFSGALIVLFASFVAAWSQLESGNVIRAVEHGAEAFEHHATAAYRSATERSESAVQVTANVA